MCFEWRDTENQQYNLYVNPRLKRQTGDKRSQGMLVQKGEKERGL